MQIPGRVVSKRTVSAKNKTTFYNEVIRLSNNPEYFYFDSIVTDNNDFAGKRQRYDRQAGSGSSHPAGHGLTEDFDMATWLVLLIGLLGGVSVGLQSPLAGSMAQRVGGTASSLIVHLSGAVFSAAVLFLRGGEGIREWRNLPWYMLAAGVFGLILYQTISVTLPRLGSTMMVVLIIIGQLLLGAVVDHFGLLGVTQRPIDITRILGIVVLILGGYLISK